VQEGQPIPDSHPTRLFLESDEFRNTVDFLWLLGKSIQNAKRHDAEWKASVIFSHAALSSACVAILTRPDGTGALKRDNEEAYFKKLYGGQQNAAKEEWPEPRTLSFENLLKSLPNPHTISLPSNKAQSYGFDRAGDLRRLNEIRNAFLHHSSESLSIEIAGLPRVLKSAVELTFEIIESERYSNRNRFIEFELRDLKTSLLSKLERIEALFTHKGM